jgi:hypothetical protein
MLRKEQRAEDVCGQGAGKNISTEKGLSNRRLEKFAE